MTILNANGLIRLLFTEDEMSESAQEIIEGRPWAQSRDKQIRISSIATTSDFCVQKYWCIIAFMCVQEDDYSVIPTFLQKYGTFTSQNENGVDWWGNSYS